MSGKHSATTRSTARASVTYAGRGTWSAHVTDSTGKVVWSDNTGGPNAQASMLDEAREAVAAVQRIENMGHRLALSWSEVLDECRGEFS